MEASVWPNKSQHIPPSLYIYFQVLIAESVWSGSRPLVSTSLLMLGPY